MAVAREPDADDNPRMKAVRAVQKAHKAGKAMQPRKGMGMNNAAATIAARPGFKGNPYAILAAGARGASPQAKAANPNLKRVK